MWKKPWFQWLVFLCAGLVLGFGLRSWMDAGELGDLRAKAGAVAGDYAQSQKLVSSLNAQVDGLTKSNRDLADRLAKNAGRVDAVQSGVGQSIGQGRVVGSGIDSARLDSLGLADLIGQIQSGLSDLQNSGGK